MSDALADIKAAADARSRSAAARRAQAPGVLRDQGFDVLERNGGAHLIVTNGRDTVDFWPGPEKWMLRGRPGVRFGIVELINALLS